MFLILAKYSRLYFVVLDLQSTKHRLEVIHEISKSG